MTRYDAVVVGSGPNGLSAANTLAERGLSVLVLEAHTVAGGAVQTESLTLPGFRHDTFSAVYPAAAASPVFRRWDLERHGLSWVHPGVAMAHPLVDGRCVSLHRDLGRTAESLSRSGAGDGDRWAEWVRPYLAAHRSVRSTLLGSFPPVRGAAGMGFRLGAQGSLEFLRVILSPASTIAEDLFRGEGARSWLLGLGMHSDLSPEMPGTAIMALHLALLGHAVGWPSPRGGASTLRDALVRRLATFGGELRVESPVQEVVARRGRVAGVRVGGEFIETGIVVCATSPVQLMRMAGPLLGGRYESRLRRFRPALGVLKIDWALKAPIPWSAADVREAGTVHVGADSPEMVAACDALCSGRFPGRPFLIVGQQSLADETRAPAGCHTAWAYTRVPPVHGDGDLSAHIDRMESQIERFAPSFRDQVLARHILTPAQMESANRSLTGGDLGGGSYSLDQMLLRPIPTLSPYRTPLRGLYLGSASTFPGGSVHGVSGWAAARCALRDQKAIPGLKYLSPRKRREGYVRAQGRE